MVKASIALIVVLTAGLYLVFGDYDNMDDVPLFASETATATIPSSEQSAQTGSPVKTMPAKPATFDLLVIVDKENSIDKYEPDDLVSLSEFGHTNRYLRNVVIDDFRALRNSASEDGISFTIPSAYRSYNTQARIHQQYIDQYGAEEAKRFSAEPGHSEHQLGTTVDFGTGNSTIDFTAEFGDSLQGIWLVQHAWEYGFIMSYPRNSEHITGYTFEPWHWRYVGRQKSAEWQRSGLTAIEFLKSRP